ncbi:acetyltransferase [Cognatishimia sp. 1_MG-2023]|uniref:acetyltransferase n=1 Tax=Cognatishimia sp. 1_MG-2023 TaxID=3062642 RepID=UPI0026E14E53|nr:acetyltransferase [Cognatishimia sp. 1_MG-2023]MDO6728356.1 acetyltransferase [Cognatishimia sp. 1_MG-2023]
MTEKEKLIVLGAGGHASVVVEAAMANNPSCHVEVFDMAAVDTKFLGFPLTTGMPNPAAFPVSEFKAIVAIGNAYVRTKLCAELKAMGYQLANVIHPRAWVSPTAQLATGVFVGANATVNSQASLGVAVIVNTGAVVEHHCVLKDGVHIAPGAVLAGAVKIGHRSFVGANTAVKEAVEVGDDVAIGAGSFVGKIITKSGTFVGVPVREMKED